MIDIDAIRHELSEVPTLPPGWSRYDTIKGIQGLPALVVGLPEEIASENNRVFSIELPLILMVGNHSPEAEGDLTKVALSVSEAFNSVQGIAYNSAIWTSIDTFQQGIFNQAEVLTTHVNLLLTATT